MAKRVANTVPSPAEFRRRLVIDADGAATSFRPDDWQEQDFLRMDSAWQWAAGHDTSEPPKQTRCWLERPRGHSKTSDIAIMACWALVYAARPIRGIAAATDKQQAILLRDAIATLARCNAWIDAVLELQIAKVVNRHTGATLEIMSSDELTSYGQLPDFVCVDEITHWKSDGLWLSLFSAAAKRRGCVLACIMNAGFQEHFAWKIREAVRTDPAWYFSHLDGAKASWIPPSRLAEQRRLLPPAVYSRLWENKWSTGSGDALNEEDLLAAVDMSHALDVSSDDFVFVAGLDVGIRRDRTACCVVGNDPRGHAYLAALTTWKPGIIENLIGKKTVDLAAVEKHVEDACRTWNLAAVYCDPWQCEQMIQSLSRRGLPVEGIPQTTTTLGEMATVLLEKFADRTIHLFEHDHLLADLRRLRLIDRPGGYRLDSPRGPAGHGDAATAFLLALLAGKRLLGDPNAGYYGSLQNKIGIGPRSPVAEIPQDAWLSREPDIMRPGETHFRTDVEAGQHEQWWR
jgi:hypothetical protein